VRHDPNWATVLVVSSCAERRSSLVRALDHLGWAPRMADGLAAARRDLAGALPAVLLVEAAEGLRAFLVGLARDVDAPATVVLAHHEEDTALAVELDVEATRLDDLGALDAALARALQRGRRPRVLDR
jgi:hypothetical protein